MASSPALCGAFLMAHLPQPASSRSASCPPAAAIDTSRRLPGTEEPELAADSCAAVTDKNHHSPSILRSVKSLSPSPYMATPLVWLGTNGPNITVQGTAAETYDADFKALAGDDYIEINGNLIDSVIQGNEGADIINLESSEIQDSTVYGGASNDLIVIRTQNGSDNQFWGDGGSDEIILGSKTFGAEYSGIIIKADGLDPTKDGIDVVYIGEDVKSFNQSAVHLGGNGNSLAGPIVADVVEYILNLSDDTSNPVDGFDVSRIVEFGAEALIVEAAEVYQSELSGGAGVDILALIDPNLSLGGEDQVESAAFNESTLNGNQGTDVIVWARDLDSSVIVGGQDDDILLGLSGVVKDTEINGNRGSDTMILLGLELDDSSIYGGKAEDSILVAGVESNNTLISGDLGNDVINFLAIQSVNTTLDGGDGDDTINDYSGAARTNSTYLSGGAGDDTITQASGVVFSEFADIFTTIDGGTGADIMTGDSTTQTSTADVLDVIGGFIPTMMGGPIPDLIGGIVNNGPKGYFYGEDSISEPIAAGDFELSGLSNDQFVFAFGDSVINAQGVGADTITDFDSDASFYRYVGLALNVDPIPGSPLDDASDPSNPFAYDRNGESFGGLNSLQRDEIKLITEDSGIKVNITLGSGGTLDSSGDDYFVNSKGLVIDGITSLSEFIEAGVQQGFGEALLWTQNGVAFVDKTFGDYTPEYGTLSYLFISDGNDFLNDSDLLIALDNVAVITKPTGIEFPPNTGEATYAVDSTGGLEITGGLITNITTSVSIDYSFPATSTVWEVWS